MLPVKVGSNLMLLTEQRIFAGTKDRRTDMNSRPIEANILKSGAQSPLWGSASCSVQHISIMNVGSPIPISKEDSKKNALNREDGNSPLIVVNKGCISPIRQHRVWCTHFT